MTKTILITGATDGIGAETAKHLASLGHRLLVHGRNPSKVERTVSELSALDGGGPVEGFVADLSVLAQVDAFARAVGEAHESLDVVIHNAGVFTAPDARTSDGLDVRFAVNTIAPYRLTQRLMPALGPSARVVNLSSAAQSPVDLDALAGGVPLTDGPAYAQSKLALTMWSNHLARSLGDSGPVVVAVNPGSMLRTKMVKDAYGVAGSDIRIGVDVLARAALSDEFADASGRYFDNDAGRFGPPHPDALDPDKCAAVVEAIEAVLARPR